MTREAIRPILAASLSFVLAAFACDTATRAADASGKPASAGVIQLDAQTATIHGSQARFMVLEGIGNICYWNNPQDWIAWDFSADQAGDYVAELKYSCEDGSEGSTFAISLGDQKLNARIAKATGTWYDHAIVKLGHLAAGRTGRQTLTLKPQQKPGGAVMNLAWLRLIPADRYAEYQQATAKEHQQLRPGDLSKGVYIVPNFHPASCGWLTNWSIERNYLPNSYLDHLDRVRDDANYEFALSECNNMIAILNFQPEHFAELKQRIQQGRVELPNAFFLEPTINLSGGEALAKMGIEGLRWQQQVMGVRPRFCWAIDTCGLHDQMSQLCAALGLEALVYTRCSRGRQTAFWSESPDGSRILKLVPCARRSWQSLRRTGPATPALVEDIHRAAADRARSTPAGSPVLFLGGVALAWRRLAARTRPSSWKNGKPRRGDVAPRFATLSEYFDILQAGIASGQVVLGSVRAGTAYTFDSFWIQCPRVKSWYRRDEHACKPPKPSPLSPA